MKYQRLIHINPQTDLVAVCAFERRTPGMSMGSEYKEEFSLKPVKSYLTRIKFLNRVSVLTPVEFETLKKEIEEITSKEEFISREEWMIEFQDKFLK